MGIITIRAILQHLLSVKVVDFANKSTNLCQETLSTLPLRVLQEAEVELEVLLEQLDLGPDGRDDDDLPLLALELLSRADRDVRPVGDPTTNKKWSNS